ncbi:MAG: YqiA/YcfP family alpha/beta fold hydrolase [Myxococcota bacterium]
MLRYAYVHGFASSQHSFKGQELRRRLHDRIEVETPDLNVPSFAKLSPLAMLEALDALDGERASAGWGLVGSSLGGWLSARWAQLRPERVRGLLLLCPGFDLPKRWPALLGGEAMASWRRKGVRPVPDHTGALQPLHYDFYRESLRSEPWPAIPAHIPTIIVHGRQDEVVPIASSRRYVTLHPHVRLVEVEDDHSLTRSVDVLEDLLRREWDLGARREAP